MDLQTFINFILPTVCGILGWFCRELWTAVQDGGDCYLYASVFNASSEL